MEIEWPEPFEDGDVQKFLEEFENTAKRAKITTDRHKLVVLRMLLKGRAEALLKFARWECSNLDYEGAKNVLLKEFIGQELRKKAMQQFKSTRLVDMCDLLSYANTLQLLLDRACRYLDPYTRRQMLEDQFLDGLPISLRERVRLACNGSNMSIDQLVNATRDLMDQTVTITKVSRHTTAELEEQAEPMINTCPINSTPTETAYESLDHPQIDEVCRFIDGPVATIDKKMPTDKEYEKTAECVESDIITSTTERFALGESFDSEGEINFFDFLFTEIPLNEAPKSADEMVVDTKPLMLENTSNADLEVTDVDFSSEKENTDETAEEKDTIAHTCENNIFCIASASVPNRKGFAKLSYTRITKYRKRLNVLQPIKTLSSWEGLHLITEEQGLTHLVEPQVLQLRWRERNLKECYEDPKGPP